MIENGGGGGETQDPGRLVRTPNPWWCERPGDSDVDGRQTSGRPTLPPVIEIEMNQNHRHPRRRLRTEAKKATRYVIV